MIYEEIVIVFLCLKYSKVHSCTYKGIHNKGEVPDIVKANSNESNTGLDVQSNIVIIS